MPTNEIQFKRAYRVIHRQQHYQHDFTRIYFRDWAVNPSMSKPGTPIVVTISGKSFYGYIHDIKSHQDNNKNFTEVSVIGASYVMRQASQAIYRNVTADQVIIEIAKKYNFAYKVVAHPRVYPQISQAGMTDWELMVRLAKQCGYFLRAENTELYFEPYTQDFEDRLQESTIYTKNDVGAKTLRPLYNFESEMGETLSNEWADKYATSVAGVDPRTGKYFKYTKQEKITPTRQSFHSELFDKHATDVVANDYTTATLEAASANEKSRYAYTAKAEVIGSSHLRPGVPVYLDNIGPEYSGYWTVLAVQHYIVEKERGTQVYTSILTVGTDSLGEVRNAKYPILPSEEPVRKLTPNSRNIKTHPVTIFKSPNLLVKPAKESSLVSRVNRAAPTGNAVAYGVWASNYTNLAPPANTSSIPAFKRVVRENYAQRR